MPDFFLTFGSGHTSHRHPILDVANPNGYVRITAADYTTARAGAWALCDRWWCWLYQDIVHVLETHHGRPWFPAGQLAHYDTLVDPEGNVTVERQDTTPCATPSTD